MRSGIDAGEVGGAVTALSASPAIHGAVLSAGPDWITMDRTVGCPGRRSMG